MLWICLHFADLPLAVFARADASESPAVTASASHRPDVIAANAAAKKRGIAPGLSIAAALALDPELAVHLRDERAEAAALERIALWAGQWTPTVAVEPPACVLLEVSGGLRYFGGAERLVGLIGAGLTEIGFAGTIAVAPMAGAASLLARAGCAIAIETADIAPALSPLSVELLEHARNSLATLHAIGVETIGELTALPRDGAARRFGQALLDEVDRALGRLPDARALFVAPERYAAQLELPAPVEEAEALLFGARRLVGELCGFLRGRGAGVTRLRCDLVHEDEAPTSIVVGLQATRQAEHIMTVLRERLARATLPDRVEAIRLASEETARLDGKDGDFFAPSRNAEAGTELVERLRARLGEEAVRTLALHADHRPERAWRWERNVSVAAAQSHAEPGELPVRPLWLLPEPRALPEGPAGAALELRSGPERIESGWWDGRDVGRDYFVGRSRRGEMLWLYRDRDGAWYVHGVFA
ncbi:MAG TPA: DNA polymerase Y family protein [Casimicrobiaceae bacterium]|nr:DNA polymerase Y family protein [Casimicrobiaceae bacterium]